MGAYIAFEGGEGFGKSTQARLLAKRLDAVLTKEPGGTELGAKLRELLLKPGEAPIGPRAETLLMAADRAQLLHDVVLPALSEGKHVISDRSVFSSLAYQGVGRDLGMDAVKAANQWATYGRWPDIVVMLQVDQDQAWHRLNRQYDRFEREGRTFHRKVQDAFEQMANDDPKRWLVIDGSGTVEEVAARVWHQVERRLLDTPLRAI